MVTEDCVTIRPPMAADALPAPRKGHDRWVINKIRALGGYYTKGFDGGAELRHSLNTVQSISALRQLIDRFFFTPGSVNAEVALDRSLS